MSEGGAQTKVQRLCAASWPAHFPPAPTLFLDTYMHSSTLSSKDISSVIIPFHREKQTGAQEAK